MAIYKVLRYPDERLRTECVPVTEFDDEFRKTADDMFETMYKNDGVGLAAPQVNIHRRFVVIDCSEDRSAKLVLANPVIVSRSGTASIDEGCLSIPEFRAKVKRSEKVHVRAQDRYGKEFELDADGLLAICIQHELDHLDGKLFIDYLPQFKKDRALKLMRKIEKEEREEGKR